jgi:hypothetical protein
MIGNIAESGSLGFVERVLFSMWSLRQTSVKNQYLMEKSG